MKLSQFVCICYGMRLPLVLSIYCTLYGCPIIHFYIVITGMDTQSCDVIFTYGTMAPITIAGGYTYNDANTPSVTSVLPVVGVTSGGDQLVITGAGFG